MNYLERRPFIIINEILRMKELSIKLNNESPFLNTHIKLSSCDENHRHNIKVVRNYKLTIKSKSSNANIDGSMKWFCLPFASDIITMTCTTLVSLLVSK